MKQEFGTVENSKKEICAAKKKSLVQKNHKGIKPTGIPWFDVAGAGAEQSMWIGVIMQAMMDALNLARDSESLYNKTEAIHWLTGNSRDFVDVCLYAGLDPDYVRRKAKKAMLSPVAWRAAPGCGKRYHERKAKRKARAALASKAEAISYPALSPGNVINGPWKNSI